MLKFAISSKRYIFNMSVLKFTVNKKKQQQILHIHPRYERRSSDHIKFFLIIVFDFP